VTTTVTLDTLRPRIDRLAATLRPGERIVADHADPAGTLVTVLAAAAAGAAAVVVDPQWTPRQRAEAVRLALSRNTPDANWIGFTSGSAGRPRPIARTARSWARSFPIVSDRTGIGPGRRVGICGPLASSLFLFGALHAMWAGAEVVLSGRWEPATLPPVDVLHCVPAMLADVVRMPRPPGLVVCGGAALPPRVRAAAEQRGTTVREYYGATELSFVAWRQDDGRLTAFPGVTVRVRDGEIWARSPYLSLGYAADVTGPLRWDDEGFATVGDLGTLDATGALTVLGRGDGTIRSGGAPVLAGDVEAALHTVAGVGDVVVLGTPHTRLGAVVTAVVEPAAGAPARLADLRAAARRHLSPAQRPRHWYIVERLPRTASGKPARAAVVAAVRAGEFARLR
jgi:long-chain acyl-CoA synthetase